MGKKLMVAWGCLFLICIYVAIDSISKYEKWRIKSLNKSEIQQINISTLPRLFESVDITSKNQVETIIDYLTSLDTLRTKLNTDSYSGMSYVIKINFKNGNKRIFNLSGNRFLSEQNVFKYEIPYDEAIKFDTIVANILEGNDDKKGYSSIIGTVITVNAEAGGGKSSCVIKDENNKTYNVNLINAHIMDSTGNGWMILHEKDIVKVFYQKEKQINDTEIPASMVYIKTAAK